MEEKIKEEKLEKEKLKEEKLKEEKLVVKEEEKEPKKPVILMRFDEIEQKVKKAISSRDHELVLLLNELTLARNIERDKRFKSAFKVVYVAFKSGDEIVKRAGVYNASVVTDPEQAEDILISEDFSNEQVLAVPRNSEFVALLK